MRILHIGDIVGKPGRCIVSDFMPRIIEREKIDFVIANGENAAAGSGINRSSYDIIMKSGVDVMTMGDHIYRRREVMKILETDPRIIKPANYPQRAKGRGYTIVESKLGVPVGVISVLGRVFMKPVDCPFAALDRAIDKIAKETKIIFVDVHAEATSDKQLIGRYLDGRVTSVLGTHTHVPTADTCILPNGTAFQCDLGMTGPHDGILGRRYDRVIDATTSFNPTQFDVCQGDVRINGAIIELDSVSGKATAIERLCIKEDEWEN